MPKLIYKTREEWLNAFVAAASPKFKDIGAPIPKKLRCSVGFPSSGKRSKVIGECWASSVSSDGNFEIFITPTIGDASRIADILTHELVHAAVGHEAKHGPVFKRAATALGLVGKMTATTAGPEWHEWADPILKALGPLPHAQLRAGGGSTTAPKKQSTRMKKLTCDSCGWSCRTSQLHIDALGGWATCPSVECEGNLQPEG